MNAKDLVERLSDLQVRRPWVPIAFVAVVTVIMGFFASRLELRTRYDALLPESQASVQELHRVEARTASAQTVLILLEGDDHGALRGMADAVTKGLVAIGPDVVSSAEDGIQAERSFLAPRAGLFLKKSELDEQIFQMGPTKTLLELLRQRLQAKCTPSTAPITLGAWHKAGLLAVDIIDALSQLAKKSPTPFKSDDGREIVPWVKTKMATDPNFLLKVEMASAYQRTGRESEVDRSVDEAKRDVFLTQDNAVNFAQDVRIHTGPGRLFKDAAEAKVYGEAILWSTASEGTIDPLI